VGALRALPEPARSHRPTSLLEPLRTVVHSRIALLVLVFAFVEGAVLLGALTLLPSAVEHTGASVTVAGAVTAVYGVAVFLGSRLVGRLSADWHPAALIGVGGAAAVTGCVLFAISQQAAMAVVVVIVFGFAWTLMHSSLQTWATEVLPTARATIVSLFAGALFVGSAIAAIVVSGPAQDGRYSLIYAGCAALALPLAVAAGIGRRRWRRPDEHANPVAEP
jgi:predicted MFS family arabinose efflux permease